MDADQYYVSEQGKYDLEGAKHLYDLHMLNEFYLKTI